VNPRITLASLPDPSPGPDDVLIRVRAARILDGTPRRESGKTLVVPQARAEALDLGSR